ncbi:MAG: hypothetical protein K2X99_08210 [Gemmatimonadaceae bacterium]|nr:hypothetical protein [Gemmatimonadaceae bacterium]
MTRSLLRTLALVLLGVRAATAQTASESIPVRTFTLQRLEVKAAAKLLSPYLQSAAAGAFEVGSDVRAITVRGTLRELRTADSLLAIFDRAPRPVLLRFQVIEATEEAGTDSRIVEVDASLRELLRYRGYRLIGEGLTKTEDAQPFEVSVGAEGASFTLTGYTESTDVAAGTIRLSVTLTQPTLMERQTLFATKLTVPVGQTVILGSAAPRFWERKASDSTSTAPFLQAPRPGRPVILTVRPELPAKR